MDIEGLKQERDVIECEPFPIADQEVCERYEKLYTGAIDDVLREHSIVENTLPHRISPLRDRMKVAGIAFTVASAPNPTIQDEMRTRAQMLDDLYEDSVIVWDTNGDEVAAHWGEVMTATALERGCRGAIIDGGVRDTSKILEQNFPIFNKFRTPRGALTRAKLVDYQSTIKIGDTLIKPGDIVLADMDGCVVVPRAIAIDVLERAEELQQEDADVLSTVKSGKSATDIVDEGGTF